MLASRQTLPFAAVRARPRLILTSTDWQLSLIPEFILHQTDGPGGTKPEIPDCFTKGDAGLSTSREVHLTTCPLAHLSIRHEVDLSTSPQMDYATG